MRFFYFTKCNHLCTRLFFKPTCISKCVPWVWQISPREVVARFGPIIVRTWITQRCIFFHPIDNFPQLIFFCGSRGVYRGFPQGFGGGEGEILIVVTHATRPVVPSMQRDVFQTTFTCNFFHSFIFLLCRFGYQGSQSLTLPLVLSYTYEEENQALFL